MSARWFLTDVSKADMSNEKPRGSGLSAGALFVKIAGSICNFAGGVFREC